MPNLHVFTGDEAADTVREALRIRDGDFLVQHDVISCGPLRSYASRDEWNRERIGFWAAMAGGKTFDPFPNDLVGEAERLGAADRIVAWVGAGLSDRMLVPTLTYLADVAGVDIPPVEVAEILSHPTLRAPVLGWGMLRSKDVGQPKRRVLTEAELAEARKTWDVVTSTDPRALAEYLEASDDTALVNALSTLVERYPDVESGLSHWDQSLLQSMPTTDTSAFEVGGGAIGANHQHLDPVGDMYLFWRLRRMAERPAPLVAMSEHLPIEPEHIRKVQVHPTELGLAVRDGRASATEGGIDDWIGGVHLQSSAGSPWYRRNGELLPRGTT
jgi:hypothetical protein